MLVAAYLAAYASAVAVPALDSSTTSTTTTRRIIGIGPVQPIGTHVVDKRLGSGICSFAIECEWKVNACGVSYEVCMFVFPCLPTEAINTCFGK
jgi:hypothetical protein